MEQTIYIQVILPLKLSWVPFYKAEPQVCVGDKVKVMFHGKSYIGTVWKINQPLPEDLPGNKVLPILSVETALARISEREIQLWEQIAAYYMCSIGEVFKTAYPARKILQEGVQAGKIEALQKRIEKNEDLARRSKKEQTREKFLETASQARRELKAITEGIARSEEGGCPIKLSEAQQKALESVKDTFDKGKPALLQGVTGSGKTEIYSRLAWETLEKGKSVVYLVPEIALSRQLEDRLRATFGNTLLVFHSHESVSKRGEAASKISLSGPSHPYIVLGTRSALFLPHHDLGLIIVDEEHDASYKQDSTPRYNGRDVATMLARIQHCPIILGTATPSLETEYNCMGGKYIKTELNQSYYGAQPSRIEIINTVAERKKRGMRGDFSLKLIERINETLANKGQVLILCNRRSYSPAIQCIDCGTIVKCPSCGVSMALHKQEGARLVCHHCGYTTPATEGCTECGGTLKCIGSGTQKIQEQAQALFPEAKVERLDSDVTSSPAEEERIIKGFAKGEIDILIGTQIITKGFDFERLSLVVVIRADSLLAVQDFRADEKALQMLRQLRGRCSRRSEQGLFIIQTSLSEHPVFHHLITGDEGHDTLLGQRHQFGYPPYTRMLLVIVRDSSKDRCEIMARELARTLKPICESAGTAKMVGPYAPAVEFFQDNWERRIRISLDKSAGSVQVKKDIAKAIHDFTAEHKYDDHISIDVDPYNI